MHVRVTCAGVVIGTAQFDLPHGLAHAALLPTADYAGASRAALALGRRFARTQYWPALDGEFARAAAARWKGGRLALQDMTGRELDVRNLVVLEGPPVGPGGATVRVVADFRPDRGHLAARARALAAKDEARTRPAA